MTFTTLKNTLIESQINTNLRRNRSTLANLKESRICKRWGISYLILLIRMGTARLLSMSILELSTLY